MVCEDCTEILAMMENETENPKNVYVSPKQVPEASRLGILASHLGNNNEDTIKSQMVAKRATARVEKVNVQ